MLVVAGAVVVAGLGATAVVVFSWNRRRRSAGIGGSRWRLGKENLMLLLSSYNCGCYWNENNYQGVEARGVVADPSLMQMRI
ncbi:hypothetical protein Peur_061844 [Populus x canadensis]